LAQPIKLAQQSAPFDLAAGGLHKLVEALLQEEGKERAKYVTVNRCGALLLVREGAFACPLTLRADPSISAFRSSIDGLRTV
jgi:hypothetical protein